MTAPAPAPAKAPSAKRGKKVVESEGVAHIAATFNNLLITITDMQGNTLAWGSAGKAGFKGSKKSTPFAATVAAENCGREAMNLGLRRVHVRVQGPGSGRESAIQALASVGLRVVVHPGRHADSSQRLPSSEEAAGLSHVTLHRSQLPSVPPRRHQAVPEGHQVLHREVPGRAPRLRAGPARPDAAAASARRPSTPSRCVRSRR